MKPNQKTQDGFSVIEVGIIVLIIGLVSGVGYIAYNRINTAPTTQTQKATKSEASTYTGWLGGILKYEKLSFKYPASWSVDNQSPDVDHVNYSPTFDSLTLTSPSNMEVRVTTIAPTSNTGPLDAGSLLSATSIATLGSNYFLDYGSTTNGSNQTDGPCVGTTASSNTSFPLAKNLPILQGNTERGIVEACIIIIDPSMADKPSTSQTVASIESNSSYHDALLILNSLTY